MEKITKGKLDLKKVYVSCYRAKPSVEFVQVPPIQYLTFQGKGNPNTSPEFDEAMGVLYGLVYTAKFISKDRGQDFTVMPLEGQWWSDPPEAFCSISKDMWIWKVMIALPDFITTSFIKNAEEILRKKKNLPGLEKAKIETMEDGLSAQFLHMGPYADEAPFIAAMHAQVKEQGYKLRGHHREIYLSDPRRTVTEKLKTIIRHPVERA